MADNKPRLYEGMFLINPTAVNSSIAACTKIVQELLDRANATVKSIHKWDDRKLAYPIDGQKRGIYMLAYFETSPDQLNHIERDVSLNDTVMRAMVLRAEHVGETELSLAVDKQKETEAEAALTEDGDSGDSDSGSGSEAETESKSSATAVAEEPAKQEASDDSDGDAKDDDKDDDKND